MMLTKAQFSAEFFEHKGLAAGCKFVITNQSS